MIFKILFEITNINKKPSQVLEGFLFTCIKG